MERHTQDNEIRRLVKQARIFVRNPDRVTSSDQLGLLVKVRDGIGTDWRGPPPAKPRTLPKWKPEQREQLAQLLRRYGLRALSKDEVKKLFVILRAFVSWVVDVLLARRVPTSNRAEAVAGDPSPDGSSSETSS